MDHEGWKLLLDGWPWFRGEGNFPVMPCSEYMSPIRMLRKPYGTWDSLPFDDNDPWGWPITEYDEALTLQPGLSDLAGHIIPRLVSLCQGTDEHGIPDYKLRDNPYWPSELAKHAHALEHERFVLLLPLALSLTQDYRANYYWTLFGNSEVMPGRAFWKGFYEAPSQEVSEEQGLAFFRALLAKCYGERNRDLRAAGFRILPADERLSDPDIDEQFPSWAEPFLMHDGDSLNGVNYLLTFRPFRDLPARVRRQYLAGSLHLLPFPGSLLFWGVSQYRDLARQIRLANQIPLLQIFERQHWPGKLRVPQAGWFPENLPKSFRHKLGNVSTRDTYKRNFRQARVHRHADCLVTAHEHRIVHVLFSTRPNDIDLYHKPMARNAQLWTHEFEPLLDGPRATQDDIRLAADTVAAGGMFGYRFLFPAMCVGRHELYWHRPLTAYQDAKTHRAKLLDKPPLGYLTAYRQHEMDFAHPVELFPRLLAREVHLANVKSFGELKEDPPRRTLINVKKLIDAWERSGRQPLPRPFAQQLLTLEKGRTLEGWLRGLSSTATERNRATAAEVSHELRTCIESKVNAPRKKSPPPSLTFEHTANRRFEEEYWNTIAYLSTGQYVNKNNADCVLDGPTQNVQRHSCRDLENVGNYLLDYYARIVAEFGMEKSVSFGELPFRWHTQYPFPWMGGWVHNQEGKAYERNLLVVIPGQDRSLAVVMADHYDTAYMYDKYDPKFGGTGARISAPGADDNCSATVALMLGARPFMELSKQGRLACDVWLLHLTGEEYPAEGQGACRMCQWLVEGDLAMVTPNGKKQDLSKVRIKGLYVLDMVAHNNDRERDIFQISPGVSKESLWLARQAHLANESWNRSTELWNRVPERRGARRFKRCHDNKTMPDVARFLPLSGEVRLHFDPRSTLYNTDGQWFSDAGIPVVLFMENYDIERYGYHDTFDTMNNIDLDYGSALAAITIESVARAATEELAAD